MFFTNMDKKIFFFSIFLFLQIYQATCLDGRIASVSGNGTLIVTSRYGQPYLMFKEPKDDKFLPGNERFEGFTVDLLEALSHRLNFTYEIKLVADQNYGHYDPEKKRWNGMIGEIIDGKADLAVSDLTITPERESVVDFSHPFMNAGLGAVYRDPPRTTPHLFSPDFLFKPEVWIMIGIAYLVTSVLLALVARCSSGEWISDSEDPDSKSKKPGVCESMWSCIGGYPPNKPRTKKSFSTRLITAIWWIFAFVMVSFYTTNLFLTLSPKPHVNEIQTIEDLARQRFVKYGTMRGSSTQKFFKDSEFPTYQFMYKVMEDNPSVFVQNTKEGILRVLKSEGTYAFFTELPTIEYEVARHCELRQIGGAMNMRGYGIAMPKDSPNRRLINEALLNMQFTGEIEMIKYKWWRESVVAKWCEESEEDSKDYLRLDVGYFHGLAAMLLIGIALSTIVATFELFWNARNTSKNNQQSYGTALVSDVKKIFKPSQNDTTVINNA